MYTYKCIINRIIDGDTLVINIDLGFKTFLRDIRVRLLNYNAPESKGIEKELGKKAKIALESLISVGEEVTVKVYKDDVFGRWLSEIWKKDVCINELLVKQGWGVAWDGKGERPAFDPKGNYPLKIN